MRERWERALDLVFPPRCAGCGARGHALCPTCRAAIPFMAAPVCPTCGRSCYAPTICHVCRAHPPLVDGTAVATVLGHPVRECIHALKYAGQRRHAAVLAAIAAPAFAALPRPDAVVPVPLHPARERERGFNQSALIARHLTAGSGIPVMPGWLARMRDTPPQVGRDLAARRANMDGAFSCTDPVSIRGKRIVILDDVATTGATLDACAAALRAAGAASVHALVVARPK
jgi:ComF family protein